MAEKGRILPVYRGWPDRDYKVVGSLRLKNPGQTWDEGDIAAAAWKAKGRGGNAIIIRNGSEFGVSQIAGARNSPHSVLAASYTSALVIRWLTNDEIEEQNRILANVWKQISVAFPDMSYNRELLEMIAAFAARSGLLVGSSEFVEKVAAMHSRISHADAALLQGDWMFKAVVSRGSAISGEESQDYLGIATFATNGDTVTIISKEGQIELSFGGAISGGRISGQLGLSSYTAKCEGVVTPEKISISFQTRAPEGVVSGNVVFQRQLRNSNENEKATSTPSGRRA